MLVFVVKSPQRIPIADEDDDDENREQQIAISSAVVECFFPCSCRCRNVAVFIL